MATHTNNVYFDLNLPAPLNNQALYDEGPDDFESDSEFSDVKGEFATEYTESCKPVFEIDANRHVGTDVPQMNDFGKCGYIAYEQERETTNFSKGGEHTQVAPVFKEMTMKPFDRFRVTQRQTKNASRKGNVSNANLHQGAYSTVPFDARTTIRQTTHLRDYVGAAQRDTSEPVSRTQYTEGTYIQGLKEQTALASHTPGPMKMYNANGACETNISVRKQLSDIPTVRSTQMKTKVYQPTPTAYNQGDVTVVKNNLVPCNTYFDPSVIRQLDGNPFIPGNIQGMKW